MSGLAVNVETYHGTVQLSGFANTHAERARAEEVAKGIEGVTTGINDALKDEVPEGRYRSRHR